MGLPEEVPVGPFFVGRRKRLLFDEFLRDVILRKGLGVRGFFCKEGEDLIGRLFLR